ncbi:Uncharacterized protein QTN25_010615 [Entamoeba marina]
MLVFLLCVTLSFAEFTWVETIDGDTLTVQHKNVDDIDAVDRSGYSYEMWAKWGGSILNDFVLNENFTFSKFIIDNSEDNGEVSEGYSFVVSSNSNATNLKIFQFMNYHESSAVSLDTSNYLTKIQVLLGCFGSQTGCIDPEGGYNTVNIQGPPVTILTDDADYHICTYYYNIVEDPFSYPYTYIDGVADQSIRVVLNKENLLPYSKMYYLFTVPSRHSSFSYQTSSWESSTDYKPGSVCSRKDINRYVLFEENQTIYTNCSCWTRDNETDMTVDSIFNYPDCNYNSTLFDLVLPSNSSTTFSLSDDLLEWYSILFTNSGQSIEINDGKTLTIDELDLNQDDISFTENVKVNNLTVTIPGALFVALDFDSINFDGIDETTVLFSIESTNTDLESHGLQKCNETEVISNKLNCDGTSIIESSSQQESSSNIESNSKEDSSSQLVEESSDNNEEGSGAMSYFITVLSVLSIIFIII